MKRETKQPKERHLVSKHTARKLSHLACTIRVTHEFGHMCRFWATEKKGHSSSPNFWSMSIVAIRSPISATAELLLLSLLCTLQTSYTTTSCTAINENVENSRSYRHILCLRKKHPVIFICNLGKHYRFIHFQ